ncbi:hypothetical protein HYPSUDRAFT_63608 [Hypholoma sublateritium FD-334 SS-4]|uniref:Uncharacterized protein n=1 Tax=Hypholoma sublateritium (strain FD-334 SS-4) TaxID=945553 RepID=A0A0D2LGR7_HYPSF|nr:hypothetical protein HYPSUDRAFT_63608 [Hypholoma sublateritium FD-334 SS-4]
MYMDLSYPDTVGIPLVSDDQHIVFSPSSCKDCAVAISSQSDWQRKIRGRRNQV